MRDKHRVRYFWQEDGPVERGCNQGFNRRSVQTLFCQVWPQRAKAEDGLYLEVVHVESELKRVGQVWYSHTASSTNEAGSNLATSFEQKGLKVTI